jgi:HD-like signal output (HDOD) protein
MFDITPEKAGEIAKNFHIPAQPAVLQQLQLEQAKEDPSPTAFAEVIVKDVALSASVLKTVNSPLFGLNRTVTDIKQSVMMLGTNNIGTLATFFQLRSSFPDKNSSISLEKFWDVAMETANMVNIVMDYLHLKSDVPAEDAYAYALFRDCGIPLMAAKYHTYKETLQHANSHPESLFTDIEDKVYQTNHAVVGYFLASGWHLPKPLCNFILRHHDTTFLDDSKIDDHDRTLYALIKLAANVLSQYKYNKADSEWALAHDQVLYFFGLSEMDYSDLEEDVKESYNIQFG